MNDFLLRRELGFLTYEIPRTHVGYSVSGAASVVSNENGLVVLRTKTNLEQLFGVRRLTFSTLGKSSSRPSERIKTHENEPRSSATKSIPAVEKRAHGFLLPVKLPVKHNPLFRGYLSVLLDISSLFFLFNPYCCCAFFPRVEIYHV